MLPEGARALAATQLQAATRGTPCHTPLYPVTEQQCIDSAQPAHLKIGKARSSSGSGRLSTLTCSMASTSSCSAAACMGSRGGSQSLSTWASCSEHAAVSAWYSTLSVTEVTSRGCAREQIASSSVGTQRPRVQSFTSAVQCATASARHRCPCTTRRSATLTRTQGQRCTHSSLTVLVGRQRVPPACAPTCGFNQETLVAIHQYCWCPSLRTGKLAGTTKLSVSGIDLAH